MNVLVTGGTGFVGRAVARELHHAGQGIHLLARPGNSGRSRVRTQIRPASIRSGDILEPDSLGDACAGMDAVIHLVGIISEAGRQTYENVHVRGTQNIIAAAQRAGVKRFVHMSALGARPDSASRYQRSKWAAEETVRGSGLAWTIFRPSIIYGPGDGFVNLFAKIIRRSPVVPLIGGGRTKFQPIAVENVARAFAASLGESRAIGQTLDLCGRETLSLGEIADAILRAMERRRLKLPVPFAVGMVQAALMEFVFGKCLRSAPPLNRDQVIMLREDNVGNGRPAEELFGLSPGKFQTGIVRYLADWND